MSITLTSISKSFSHRQIFLDFSYEFKDTGLYIIEGESGVGKTTLLRIIAGLDTDYVGGVIGAGVGKCSFMFQEYRLFPTISAFENVTLVGPNNNSENQAKELLFRLGLTDEDILLYPSQLSGGMKQRVSFARAVFSDKPIILLDEPTKELDSATADKMLEIISELSKKKCVIMVSHVKSSHILSDAIHINL